MYVFKCKNYSYRHFRVIEGIFRITILRADIKVKKLETGVFPPSPRADVLLWCRGLVLLLPPSLSPRVLVLLVLILLVHDLLVLEVVREEQLQNLHRLATNILMVMALELLNPVEPSTLLHNGGNPAQLPSRGKDDGNTIQGILHSRRIPLLAGSHKPPALDSHLFLNSMKCFVN